MLQRLDREGPGLFGETLVAVDLETAKAGAALSERIKDNAGAELARITDGAVTTPNALIPLKQWLVAHGCDAAPNVELWLEDHVPKYFAVHTSAGAAGA